MPFPFDMNSINTPYFSIVSVNKNNTYLTEKVSWSSLKCEVVDKVISLITNNSSGNKNIVIYSKTTLQEIKKPFDNIHNIVVSTSLIKNPELVGPDVLENINLVSSFSNALKLATTFGINKNIFVMGNNKLKQEAVYNPYLECIYNAYYTVGNFMAEYRNSALYNTRCNTQYNKDTDEYGYINLLKKVLSEGEERDDRTGVGTLSLFGEQIVFNLDRFPLITTKRVSLKTVFEELMWMLRGQTSNKILNEKGIKIWDGNSTREFLDKRGLDYPEDELGPVYGAQWRNFGGQHDLSQINHIANKNTGGIDQIKNLINEIKTNPESRRLFVSAWNPQQIDKMALPPCHLSFQIYIRQKKYMDCKLYMRSNDLFLGAPFNIASYSLLVYMLCSVTGYTPGKLIYSIGDSHIYKNHISQVKEQMQRPIRNFPTLTIKNKKENIEDYEYSDFLLENYCPHPTIKGDMAV